jgi:hypothetical protein
MLPKMQVDKGAIKFILNGVNNLILISGQHNLPWFDISWWKNGRRGREHSCRHFLRGKGSLHRCGLDQNELKRHHI